MVSASPLRQERGKEPLSSRFTSCKSAALVCTLKIWTSEASACQATQQLPTLLFVVQEVQLPMALRGVVYTVRSSLYIALTNRSNAPAEAPWHWNGHEAEKKLERVILW